MTPEEELDNFVPPWELSDEAWALLKRTDPKGYLAAQELLRLFKERGGIEN